MIEHRQNEIIICDGLQNALSTEERICTVVFANQTAPVPDYPYVSYTITQPVVSDNRGYCIDNDGNRYKETLQVWSFTIHSDDDVEAMNIAIKTYNWFNAVSKVYLGDNGIIVQKIGNINNRDNLISIEYEHCNGFDITFNLIDKIESKEFEYEGTIETVDIKEHNINVSKN